MTNSTDQSPRARLAAAWRNAFYRNSMVYCMALLTLLVILHLVPVTGSHCGF